MAVRRLSVTFVAALAMATLCCSGLSNAAAPVLSTPKPGLSGQTPGVPNSTVPDTTLPVTSGKPAKAPPKPASPDHTNGHDHDTSHGKYAVIETVDLPVLPVLVRTTKANWNNGYAAIRASIAALRAEATRAKLEPKGRPLIVYIESGDQDFRVDVLLPLASEPAKGLRLSNGFRSGHNPGGKAMKFEHRGAYSKIEGTYEAITAYLDEKSLNAREFFIEEFVNEVADPADIKMAVNIYVFLK